MFLASCTSPFTFWPSFVFMCEQFQKVKRKSDTSHCLLTINHLILILALLARCCITQQISLLTGSLHFDFFTFRYRSERSTGSIPYNVLFKKTQIFRRGSGKLRSVYNVENKKKSQTFYVVDPPLRYTYLPAHSHITRRDLT